MSTLLFVRKSSAVIAGMFLCLPLLCGQQAPMTPPPAVNPGAQKPGPDKKGSTDTESKSAAGSSVDSNSYKVGPADVLSVKVWNEEKFSGPVVVHQDGMITLPLVGDLTAGGTTPKDIEKVIAAALAKYVMKPLVTVTVQEVVSKRYYLDGMASHPGEYQLAVPTTILEAISKAGGLQDFANAKKIFVLRGDKRISFNYKDVLHGKRMEQNIQVEPGDHIVIP
ncbi:MAG TPA: polysaccharide biosynthesis/export family protein [Bryobacteraceae bacterium]|nr:polysaccharide biosynthesis/export family protein [Bryobacteraceae bacterium]